MSLAEQLDKIREGGAKRIPPEKRAIMTGATERLRASGILDRTVKVGDDLPAFTLDNAYGKSVQSADLLAKGAVVLTVFRGSW